MKRLKLSPIYILILMALPIWLDGCKKVETGLSSITWEINFDLVTTTWDLQFIDAATGVPIGVDAADQVQVTVTGGDAHNIIDLAGVRQPIFYSTNGFIAMALHPDRPAPDNQTPVRFVIHASHGSYFPVTMPVISYHAGINPVKIYMVNRTNPPVDVYMPAQAAVAQVTNGVLNTSLDLSTSHSMASLHLETGTEILNSGGARPAGNLKVAFSYWAGATVNGLKTLPGGQIAVNAAGTPGLIYLAGAVYTDFMDQNGAFAGTVSKPMICNTLISSAVYNPATKVKVSAGQIIPVWHLNAATGIWESKGDAILKAAQDSYTTDITMDSPGLYVAGWIDEGLCTKPLVLHPGTLQGYNEIPYAFTVNIFELFNNELRYVRTVGISNQVTLDYELSMLPDNSDLLLRFESYTGEANPYYRNPDPILLSGFCQAGSPVNFDLVPKANSTYKKIEVVFIDVAHNHTRYNPKVFPGYYRKEGTTDWLSAFVFGGMSHMINPEIGAKYEMGINFKGKFHLKEVTVGTEDVLLVEIDID